MEAVAATGPGCEAGKCSGPGGLGTGPDFGDFSESVSPAAVWSGLPELRTCLLCAYASAAPTALSRRRPPDRAGTVVLAWRLRTATRAEGACKSRQQQREHGCRRMARVLAYNNSVRYFTYSSTRCIVRLRTAFLADFFSSF